MTTQIEDVVVVIAYSSERHIELYFLGKISSTVFVDPWVADQNICQAVGVDQPVAVDRWVDDDCRCHDFVANQPVADSHHVQVVRVEQRVAVLLAVDRLDDRLAVAVVTPAVVAVEAAGLSAGLPVELDGLVLVVVPLVGQLAVRTVWAWLLGPGRPMLTQASAQSKELFACA